MRPPRSFLAALLLAATFAGCFGGDGRDAPAPDFAGPAPFLGYVVPEPVELQGL